MGVLFKDEITDSLRAPEPDEDKLTNPYQDQQLAYMYGAIEQYAKDKGYPIPGGSFEMAPGSRPYGPNSPSVQKEAERDFKLDQDGSLFDKDKEGNEVVVGKYDNQSGEYDQSTTNHIASKSAPTITQTSKFEDVPDGSETEEERIERLRKLAEALTESTSSRSR